MTTGVTLAPNRRNISAFSLFSDTLYSSNSYPPFVNQDLVAIQGPQPLDVYTAILGIYYPP